MGEKQPRHPEGILWRKVKWLPPVMASKAMIHPLQRARMVLTLQAGSVEPEGRHRGVFDTLRRVRRDQGVGGWFKALDAVLVRLMVNTLASTLTQGAIGAIPSVPLQVLLKTIGLGTALPMLICQPLDAASSLLHMDLGPNPRFDNALSCLPALHQIGVRGFLEGHVIAYIGSLCYRAIYFGLHDTLHHLCFPTRRHPSRSSTKGKEGKEGKEGKTRGSEGDSPSPKSRGEAPPAPSFIRRFVMSMVVTTGGTFLTFPLDLVRRRLFLRAALGERTAGGAGGMGLASPVLAAQIYREEGIAGFFRGSLTNMVVSFASAASLILCESWFDSLAACLAPAQSS